MSVFFASRADMKNIGVNIVLYDRFPWEVLLYGVDALIPGLPHTVRPSITLYSKIVNCGNAVWEVLGGRDAGCQPIETTIKLLKPHYDTFVNYDRTWSLDWIFLTEHLAPLLAARIHNRILNSFPTAVIGPSPTYQSVIDKIKAAKGTEECLALSVQFSKDLQTAIYILEGIRDHRSPDQTTLAKYGSFHAAIVKAAEPWCYHTGLPAGKSVCSKDGAGVALFGKEALMAKFEAAKKEVAENGVGSVNKYQEFRRFAWMLDPSESAVVDKWIQDATKKHRASWAKTAGAIEDGSVAETTAVLGGEDAMVVHIDSKAIAAPPAPVAPLSSKEQDVVEAKKSKQKVAMAKLFGSKVKVTD